MNSCEGIFKVHIDVYPHSCSELEHLMRAMSSAFCAEVPTGSGRALMIESRDATAYPAKCMLSWTKLLPPVKYSMSGLPIGWSVRSGWLHNF
jgi:hypothetical protein